MASVMTVKGPVDADSLGIVSMHEHLIHDLETSFRGGIMANFDDVEIAIQEVRALQEAGGRTLVEVTNREMGRDVRKLRQIAETTGLNIVAATGYYGEQTYPREVFERTIPQLADLVTREITEGIEGTGIRAGIIGEIGTRRRFITPAEERVFRAAARAQLRTGVAITTHTYWGAELALEQIAILTDEGVPPDRIIVGHLGDKRLAEHYARIAATGVFVEFDHVGKTDFLPDRDRAAMIVEMVDRGFERQILLSRDVFYRSELHYFGGLGYDHLLTGFVPELRAAGVGSQSIERMLVGNPRHALGGDP